MKLNPQSKKSSKQRKALFSAPLHQRHKLMSVHLSKQLKKQYSTRSLSARKGDEVKVMRGSNRGFTGKIEEIDLKRLVVFIDGLKRKKVSGAEARVPVHPSNVLLLNPVMDDPKRQKILKRKMKEKEKG